MVAMWAILFAVTLLENVMPVYDVNEVHSIWVPAEPDTAYQALLTVSAREVRLIGPLMRLRTLGRSRLVADRGAPLLDEMKKAGFVDLGARPGKEVVLGAVGRFWSPLGNRPVAIRDFSGFDEPGYAKAAMNFTVEPAGAGSRVTTETRIVGTDAAARRKFRAYWLLIRLGSGAIRRSWLKAIRRRLERRPPDSAHAAP
jgi:hypothetical protein